MIRRWQAQGKLATLAVAISSSLNMLAHGAY